MNDVFTLPPHHRMHLLQDRRGELAVVSFFTVVHEIFNKVHHPQY